MAIMSDLLKCVMKRSAVYDPSDTFLRHTVTVVKQHDDKASPRGECSPFIQQRVMKTCVLIVSTTKSKHLTWNYCYFFRTIIRKSTV